MCPTDDDDPVEKMRIRDATADDVAAMADLATQLGYPSQPEEMYRRLTALQSERSAVLVALAHSNVVGLVQVSLEPTMLVEARATIDALVVDGQHQGEGVGRALLSAAESWAANRGCLGMCVRSNIKRQGAHAFYRKLGYILVKTSLVLTKELQSRAEHCRRHP